MKHLSLFVALVLVTLLHPTAIFAMDSKVGKVAEKTTEKIVTGIGKLFSGKQKVNLTSELDEVIEGRGSSSPQASSFFSSKNTTSSPSSHTVTSIKSPSNNNQMASTSINLIGKEEGAFITPEKKLPGSSNTSDTISESSLSQPSDGSPSQNSDSSSNTRISEASCSSIASEKSLVDAQAMATDQTSSFIVTRDILHQILLQANATSNYATDTINSIRKIYEILNSKKDYANGYKLSSFCEKVMAANTATNLVQKGLETRLKQLECPHGHEMTSLTFNDISLLMRLDLAVITVEETIKETITVAKNIMEEPLYQGKSEKEALVPLEAAHTIYKASCDPAFLQKKIFDILAIKSYDPSMKQNLLRKALQRAEAAKAYAKNIDETMDAATSFFNNMSEFGSQDLDDASDAWSAIDAEAIVVDTLTKKVNDRLSQLEKVSKNEVDSEIFEIFSLNDAMLLEEQKLATTDLIEKIQQANSLIAERIKKYPWYKTKDKILEDFSRICAKFLTSYELK